jgi:hypothetical protein
MIERRCGCTKSARMKQQAAKSLRAFAIELAVYAVLVVIYFFLVLHLLGDWLYRLESHHRYVYAGVALLLIAGQAVALDTVTTLLFRLLRGRWR